MISILCDGCSARFPVADEAAGTTVFCPKCGAKNGVPETGGVAAAPVAGKPPQLEEGEGIPGEQLLLRVRPAMFRARPVRFTVLFLVAVGGIAGGGYLLTMSQTGWGVACLVASLLGWGPLAVWKVHNLGTSLEISNKRTVEYRGLLSKSSTEVRHEDIKNFQVDQTFLNRIMGIGTVAISSSAQHEEEILVKDLPGPYRIREAIDAHRKL